MNRFVAVSVVAGMVMGPAILMAEETPKAGHGHKAGVEHKAAGEHKPAALLQDLVLTGKITQEEKKTPDGARTYTVYVLTTTDGKTVRLPPPKADSTIKLEDYLNVDVKVTARGHEATGSGKTVARVAEIVNIEKVAAEALAPATVAK